jgi:hypothetical protein
MLGFVRIFMNGDISKWKKPEGEDELREMQKMQRYNKLAEEMKNKPSTISYNNSTKW